jgi:hypothetical protein
VTGVSPSIHVYEVAVVCRAARSMQVIRRILKRWPEMIPSGGRHLLGVRLVGEDTAAKQTAQRPAPVL